MYRCWSVFLPTFICHSRVCFLRAFRKSYINFKIHIALLEKPNIWQFHWLFNIKYATLVIGWIGFSRRHNVLWMTFHSATRYLWRHFKEVCDVRTYLKWSLILHVFGVEWNVHLTLYWFQGHILLKILSVSSLALYLCLIFFVRVFLNLLLKIYYLWEKHT